MQCRNASRRLESLGRVDSDTSQLGSKLIGAKLARHRTFFGAEVGLIDATYWNRFDASADATCAAKGRWPAGREGR